MWHVIERKCPVPLDVVGVLKTLPCDTSLCPRQTANITVASKVDRIDHGSNELTCPRIDNALRPRVREIKIQPVGIAFFHPQIEGMVDAVAIKFRRLPNPVKGGE